MIANLSPKRTDAPQPARASKTPPAGPDAAAIVQGLRRIVRALELYSQDVYRTYGLTGPQLWVLKTLQRDGPLSAGHLAQALAVHQSSVSVLIQRLERRGLVRRARVTPDRRFVRVELTERGAALATEAPEPAQGRLLHGLDAMPPQEVRKIRRAVDRLVQVMEASDVAAQFFFSDEYVHDPPRGRAGLR
jgi:DNA-binding MarR family transcriptional regulator